MSNNDTIIAKLTEITLCVKDQSILRNQMLHKKQQPHKIPTAKMVLVPTQLLSISQPPPSVLPGFQLMFRENTNI